MVPAFTELASSLVSVCVHAHVKGGGIAHTNTRIRHCKLINYPKQSEQQKVLVWSERGDILGGRRKDRGERGMGRGGVRRDADGPALWGLPHRAREGLGSLSELQQGHTVCVCVLQSAPWLLCAWRRHFRGQKGCSETGTEVLARYGGSVEAQGECLCTLSVSNGTKYLRG